MKKVDLKKNGLKKLRSFLKEITIEEDGSYLIYTYNPKDGLKHVDELSETELTCLIYEQLRKKYSFNQMMKILREKC